LTTVADDIGHFSFPTPTLLELFVSLFVEFTQFFAFVTVELAREDGEAFIADFARLLVVRVLHRRRRSSDCRASIVHIGACSCLLVGFCKPSFQLCVSFVVEEDNMIRPVRFLLLAIAPLRIAHCAAVPKKINFLTFVFLVVKRRLGAVPKLGGIRCLEVAELTHYNICKNKLKKVVVWCLVCMFGAMDTSYRPRERLYTSYK
jgi:hypothetical protein